MSVDIYIATLDLKDTYGHLCPAESHRQRRKLFHLPPHILVHPGRRHHLDFVDNQALILGYQKLHEPGLIVEHFFVIPELAFVETLNAYVVPVGRKCSGDAMPMHQPIAEHTGHSGHVRLV